MVDINSSLLLVLFALLVILFYLEQVFLAILFGIVFIVLLLYTMLRSTKRTVVKEGKAFKGFVKDEAKLVEEAPGKTPQFLEEMGRDAAAGAGEFVFGGVAGKKPGVNVKETPDFAKRFFDYIKKIFD